MRAVLFMVGNWNFVGGVLHKGGLSRKVISIRC